MDFSSEKMAKDKLIILYLLNKLNITIDSINLMKIVLENKFMNYFMFQKALSDLTDNNFLDIEQLEESDSYTYKINNAGIKTLNLFGEKIPLGIKSRIDYMTRDLVKNIKDKTSIIADYTPQGKNDFLVRLKISEDNFLFMDLKFSVGTIEEAKTICEEFRKAPQDIYSNIIQCLALK